MTATLSEPGQVREIVERGLKPPAVKFPNNPDIQLQLAMALFNLSNKVVEPEQARRIIDGELRPLAADFAGDPRIQRQLAKALVNLTIEVGEPKQAWQIFAHDLAPLVARFPQWLENGGPFGAPRALSSRNPRIVPDLAGDGLRSWVESVQVFVAWGSWGT
ncbi:MAG: hypothetical protein FWD29_02575 [Micrococcales bacterium]|nr:hypothetical protein [Micrococcales bacterium]